MYGSTHNTIYMPDIQAFRFALPPVPEQMEIVQQGQEESKRLNLLITECEGAIRLLTERRAALISAAVTGQIDVRRTASASALAEDWNTVHATVGSFADEHSTL